MERTTFSHSDKNIPVPQHRDYLKRLIEMTEPFLRRLRWRAFFFLHPEAATTAKETYGFNTTKSPMPIPELIEFESGVLSMIQDVKNMNTENKFQNQLAHEVDKINKDNKLYIAADKTSNYYRMDKTTYMLVGQRGLFLCA